MDEPDYALETLLSLDGSEFRFAGGYRVKIEAARVTATRQRPHGVKYSLTLHDPKGRRIYGLDNAHRVRRARAFDHRHVYRGGKVVPYAFKGPVELLEDFYREVDRILLERGMS